MTPAIVSRRFLTKVTLGAAVAQVAMVVCGHFVPFVRENVFAVGGMSLSLVFGAGWA